MPNFHYEGRDAAGAAVKGVLECSDRRAALRRLEERGVRIVSLTEGRDASGRMDTVVSVKEPAELGRRRLFGPHLVAMAFLENYRELLAGGLPPGDAVRLMATRVTDPALKFLCAGLWRDLSEGGTLADAMSRRPVVFEEAVVRLIEAGEKSGRLDAVAVRILEDFARREALRSRMLGALAYPVFVCGLAMLVLAMFVFFVMPRMEAMMHSLGGEFPWSVKAVMVVSGFFVKGLPFVLLLGACAIPWFRRRRATPEGRVRQDALLLRLPLVGTALLHGEAAKLADLLATLLASGLTATDALRLAERPIANASLKVKFAEVRRRVSDGASFTMALREAGLFEPADLDLTSVGENAGSLSRAFAAVAERRRRALDKVLKRLVVVMTGVFLGGAIGLVFFCLLSIITTILSVSHSVLPHR